MRFKRSFTDPVPRARERRFVEAGVTPLHGRARFVSERALQVGGERIEAERIVLATGSKPAPLAILGAEHLTTSDLFLELDHLPERVIFLGGSYLSFELAHVAARAGAKVRVLEAGERDAGGVIVDPYLRSISNPAVYAAGDCAFTAGAAITPVAAIEGEAVAHNLVSGDSAVPDYTGVPTICFTVPPIAAVGLLEEKARERRLGVRVHCEDISTFPLARVMGETCAGSKVLVDEETGRIVGAHFLGPGAEELVNLVGIAMRAGMPAHVLKTLPFGYPTAASFLARML